MSSGQIPLQGQGANGARFSFRGQGRAKLLHISSLDIKKPSLEYCKDQIGGQEWNQKQLVLRILVLDINRYKTEGKNQL